MLTRLTRLFEGDVSQPPAARAALPQDDSDTLLAPAVAAIRQGRGDEAIALLEALLEGRPGLSQAHLMLGTCRHERGEIEDARDHYLLAATLEPAWGAPHFHLGVLCGDSGRHAEAASAFVRALQLDPPQARVHNALGAAYLLMGDAPAAVEQFRLALGVNPDFAPAHSNLGLALLRDLELYDEGTRHVERALALAPDDPAVQCNHVMALQHWGRRDEALALAEKLLARDPGLAEARMNRALMLLGRGELGEAWDDYEARRHLPGSDLATGLPCPQWQGEPLEGRSIFVHPEQGLGDEIMFASCIPDLVARGGRCTLGCHAKLEGIFRRSFPAVEVLAKDERRGWVRGAQRSWDYQVAAGSLPRFLRRAPADFPAHAGYLRADPERVAFWRARLAARPGRLKVGLSWRGGLASTRRSLRSIPLALWRPALAAPDVDFVSLQYGAPEGDLEALRQEGCHGPQHWPEAIADYDETAALVCALDLVISVQTAVVHLAGALGKEVWALIPQSPEWRYGGEGAAMPWYPAARLLRQAQAGVWTDVIDRVRDDLQDRCAATVK